MYSLTVDVECGKEKRELEQPTYHTTNRNWKRSTEVPSFALPASSCGCIIDAGLIPRQALRWGTLSAPCRREGLRTSSRWIGRTKRYVRTQRKGSRTKEIVWRKRITKTVGLRQAIIVSSSTNILPFWATCHFGHRDLGRGAAEPCRNSIAARIYTMNPAAHVGKPIRHAFLHARLQSVDSHLLTLSRRK